MGTTIMRRVLQLAVAVSFGVLALSAQASAQTNPTINSVVFRGGPANPEVVIRGRDFGLKPAAQPVSGTSNLGKCGPIAGDTGEDFGLSLWISDESQLWSAGNDPLVDCMGLQVNKYTSTKIVYRLGSFYKIHYKARNNFSHGIYELKRGDVVVLWIGGTQVTVRVRYNQLIRNETVAGSFVFPGTPDNPLPSGTVSASSAGGLVGGTLNTGGEALPNGHHGFYTESFSGHVTCLKQSGDTIVVGAVGRETKASQGYQPIDGGPYQPTTPPTVDPRQFVQFLYLSINQPPTLTYVVGGGYAYTTQRFDIAGGGGFPSTTPPDCTVPSGYVGSYPNIEHVAVSHG